MPDEYNFSGQATLSFGDIVDEPVQQKDKENKQYSFSGQEDLFPKEAQPLSKPPAKITSKFGIREDPFGLGKKFHNGVDIPMKSGTPISSLGRGIVIDTGDDGGKNYGRYVTVDYGGGLQLTYGHLNKIGVEIGDKVTSDALVGVSGSTGRSKGPHLHIKAILNGKPVNPEDYFGSIHDVALGALSGNDIVEGKKYDFSGQTNISDDQIINNIDPKEFDLSGQETIGEFSAKPIEEAKLTNNVKEYSEYLARGGAALSQPKLSVRSPDEFVGNPVITSINMLYDPMRPNLQGIGLRPTNNQIVDTWLGALDPSYVQLNSEYRNKTGKNIVQIDPNRAAVYKGNGKWEIRGRLTYGAKELINTYIEARNKGGVDAGIEAVYFKNQQLDRQANIVADEVKAAKTMNKDRFAQKHPYLQTLFNILNPSSIATNEPESIKSGLGNFGVQEAQMFHNLRMLPEALYTLSRYGGDSDEYKNLIERDKEIQNRIYGYGEEIYQPQTISGKITSGVVTGAISFPKYAVLGSAGLPTLPTLVYVENIHRGNPEAAKQALTMAVLVGGTHGLEKFFGAGTKAYVVAKDKNGVEFIKQIEIDRGLGNKAPFTGFKEARQYVDEWGNITEPGSSLLKNEIKGAFIGSSPASINSLSPLERQLIMRGANAFSQSGLSALEGGDIRDVAANFVVGLSFPVGKDRTTRRIEGKLGLIPYIPEVKPKEPRINLLAQPRINVEGENSTLFIPLDDAALNLLELRRALKDPNTIKGLSLKDSVARQVSIQKAINALASQIPAETLQYFEKNEGLIRSAIKSNYEANKAKEEYLGNKTSDVEFKTPSDIKENPSIDLKESPIDRLKRVMNVVKNNDIKENRAALSELASEAFGNDGQQNGWITPDRALLAFDRFANTKSKGGNTLHSVGPQDLAAIGKDIVEGGKAIVDLTQISAFYLEDFYHRKIEPSVTELANKFRIALGDVVKGFSDKDFQTLFEKGKEYLDSNIADPFFSRMKQDAVEKLPNRFNVEQARNILSQHKDEFEWTSGLNEFLEANKDRKINKQELVDVIQKGQIRVKESVAEELSQQELQRINEVDNRITELNQNYKHEYAQELSDLYKERDKLETRRLEDRPKYSLQRYTGEKLELAGAKNSKEVILISPIPLKRAKSFTEFLAQRGLTEQQYDQLSQDQRSALIDKYNPVGRPLNEDLNILYKSSHWSDVANPVAHYRANDRITTDGKRAYHSEEFQSDWMHDIRILGLKGESLTQQEKVRLEELLKIAATRGQTEEELIEYQLLSKRDLAKGIEPNPFMQHNWKELVLKRFLRDAAIAKDENGNYKYDGVSWTTAKQQLERYGGILEGKEFKWRKNSDGTYSFELKPSTDADFRNDIHELNHISLERFAELTTKEAADFVREQEAARNDTASYTSDRLPKGLVVREDPEYYGLWVVTPDKYDTTIHSKVVYGSGSSPEKAVQSYLIDGTEPNGQFSLKEAVELRSGKENKYADYDIAYKNILNKIGKRFGAKYSEKEIELPNQIADDYSTTKAGGREKIHYLEITPSMRSSLEKEGLPLYGTGGSEPLKSSEVGVRNKLVTFDAFNQAREDLVKRLSNEDLGAIEHKGTTFNSGLNPEAFIDQVKLLYSGIKDLVEFTKVLSNRYGPYIERFAEDLYWSIRGKASDFNDRLNISINKWQENLNKVADDPAWQIRNSEKNERGSFSLRRKNSPELEDYYNDKEKHQLKIGYDYRAWLRGIALAQISVPFGKIYDTMRSIQRVVSAYETSSINQLIAAKKMIKAGLDGPVADAIYQGNEWINPATGNHEGKVWSDTELATNFSLNTEQINAYKKVRAAIDNVLNLRLENKLYSIRESARGLTDKLLTLTAGTPEYDSIKEKLVDLSDLQAKTIKHYDDLKNTGYISLQRRGNVAVYLEDPNLPIGDPNRKIYNQFEVSQNLAIPKAIRYREVTNWIKQQKKALGVPEDTKIGNIYDIKNLGDIVLKEKLTPSQFEDLVDRSTANANDPQIEKLREEVYSKFPSFTYQLKREFVRGYDRDLQTALNSTIKQLELYASSFYSKVGREEGLKQLEATGIEKSDPNLYRIAKSYIADETVPHELNWLGKSAVMARRFTYLWQLGFDINQLWLNAVAQPITQTYSYFYRIEDPNGTGKRLTGLEPEHYFLKAGKLAAQVLKAQNAGADVTANFIKLVSKVMPGSAATEFQNIVNRLTAERVLTPEFTKTYIESRAGTGKATKIEHWASTFMRGGENVTRTHAAAEAYLIGTEKFNLKDDQLINFIVKAVDSTQSNPTVGENPFVIRQLGEGGKLFYQFIAFNQMWWENLALGTILDQTGASRGRKTLFAARHLAPLAIMGGISGMPLAAFASTMYTLLTDKEPKKEMDKYLGDDTLIEQAVRYGITTSASISQKSTPSAPVLDQLGRVLTTDKSNIEDLLANAPAIATGNQIWKLRKAVTGDKKLKTVVDALPRALKGPANAAYTYNEGYKAGDTTLLSKKKITPIQTIGQTINVVPTPVIEKFEQQRTKKLKRFRKSLKKAF